MSNDYAVMMRNGIKLPPGAKPRNSGRQLAAHVPTENEREMVRVLSANGVSQEIMAQLLHISYKTLTKHFKDEIKNGQALVTAKMGAALVKEGFAGNVAAQRFWLGVHGGDRWRLPKNSDLMSDVFDSEGARTTVHFYMPSNGRDEPEDLEPPVIDGEVEDAA